MKNNVNTTVHLAFERECKLIPLELLTPSIPLSIGIKETVKFRQIAASIKVVGLVEPLVVVRNPNEPDHYILLDGRLRLMALIELSATSALCLLSTDDEAYTYNKRVNRVSPVQEHRMILKAVERGVSVEQLANALDVTPGAIKQQFKMLDGICPEAILMLADKPTTYGMFKALRKMKPVRQIDVVHAMIGLGNYSVKLALAMLQASRPEDLTAEAVAQSQSLGPSEALHRLERELAAVQSDTRLLEEGYGPSNLQLEIIKTYISRTLLENATVVRWLAKNRAEYLQQLQLIADMRSLQET